MNGDNDWLSMAAFAEAVPWVGRFGELCVLADAPGGPGPLISDVRVDDGQSPDDRLASATVETDDVVFRLIQPMETSAVAPQDGTLLVSASPHLGSAGLAAALAVRSLGDVFSALSYDVVIVPVVQSDDGLVTRVFPGGAGQPGFNICLFSSAE